MKGLFLKEFIFIVSEGAAALAHYYLFNRHLFREQRVVSAYLCMQITIINHEVYMHEK